MFLFPLDEIPKRKKRVLAALRNLVNLYGGVYYPLSESSGSVAQAINPALALGRNVLPSVDFTDGWATFGNVTITNATTLTFTGAGSAGVYKNLGVGVSKSYTLTAAWVTTPALANAFVADDAGLSRIIIQSATGGTGAYTAATGYLTFGSSGQSNGDTFVLTSATLKQTNILASTAYPGSELLNTAGASGTATAANWSTSNNANLTNPSTDILRIARIDSINPNASESVYTIGKRYILTGEARSDGNATPILFNAVTIWSGTTSTDWQSFSVETIATAVNRPSLVSITSTGTEYTEWRNISITEVNPLNGDNTGATVGATGIGDGLTAYTFDGTNDYVNIYSAEMNSVFNPNAGTLLIWAKVSGAGVWTDGVGRRLLNLTADVTSDDIYFQRLTGNNSLRIVYSAGGVVDYHDITISTTDWFLMAMTWDTVADEINYYLNGQSVGTDTGIGTFSKNLVSTGAVIGAQTTTPGGVWSGEIQHPVLFRTALSATEILRLYNLGK